MKPFHRVDSKRTILAAAAVALALAGGAHEAHAVTDWAVPGTICNWTPNTPGILNYNANGVFNTSGVGQLAVSCPITTIQGLPLQNGGFFVKVYDRNSSQEVSCTLYTNAQSGASVFSQTMGSNIGFAGGLTSIGYTFVGSGAYGANLDCSIPVVGAGISHIATIQYRM